MTRLAPWVIAFALVIGGGVAAGLQSYRWSGNDEFDAVEAKLKDLPDRLGAWTRILDAEETLTEDEKNIGEIEVYQKRSYRNAKGTMVDMIIVCGRPGPISVHTPDVCMRGAGFEMKQHESETVPLPLQGDRTDANEKVNAALFERKDSTGPSLRHVYWAWSDGGSWSAESPRWKNLHRPPFIFKVYVWRGLAREDESLDKDPCLDLIGELFTELHARLAPSP
jgi:hypothetical protein